MGYSIECSNYIMDRCGNDKNQLLGFTFTWSMSLNINITIVYLLLPETAENIFCLFWSLRQLARSLPVSPPDMKVRKVLVKSWKYTSIQYTIQLLAARPLSALSHPHQHYQEPRTRLVTWAPSSKYFSTSGNFVPPTSRQVKMKHTVKLL